MHEFRPPDAFVSPRFGGIPTFMDKASLQLGKLYLGFWLANGDSLLQRFVKFAAQ